MICKKVIMKSLFASTVLLMLFSSCSFTLIGNTRDDLLDLAAFAAGLDAVMRSVADSQVFAPDSEARTVNPKPQPYITSDDKEITIKDTPLETYNDLGGSGNTIHVPGSSGYLRDWYGNPALNARFTMQPYLDDYFRIKLHIYDTSDFLLDFVYEEYLVSSEGSWEALDSSFNPGFISYYDRMTDGSRISHFNWEFGGSEVYDITVPVVHEDLTAYTFTIRDNWVEPTMFEPETVIPAPQRTSQGDFYIYKESTGNYQAETASRSVFRRPDSYYEAKSFYAEQDNQDTRTMAVFSLQNVSKNKGNVARTVTRSRESYNEHSLLDKLVRSLTTFSYRNSNPWQHIVREIDYCVEDNLVTLNHSEEVYWGGSTVNGNPDRITTMNLLQNSQGSSGYTGTMEVTWKNSSWVDTYEVTFNGKKFKLKPTGGYHRSSRFLDAAANSGIGIEFDLAQTASGREFSIQLPAGSRFTGFWEFGVLTGTLEKPNGEVRDIEVFGGAILIDGELWTSSR